MMLIVHKKEPKRSLHCCLFKGDKGSYLEYLDKRLLDEISVASLKRELWGGGY